MLSKRHRGYEAGVDNPRIRDTPHDYVVFMARTTRDFSSVLVVVNPDEDCSAVASREILDEILGADNEPLITSLNAAEVVRRLRSPDS